MGILDFLKHNKINGPEVVKDVDNRDIMILEDLLDKVADSQKDIVNKELYNIKAGLEGESKVMYELKHLNSSCLILHDITLFDRSAEQSQIDFIVLTPKCGFVLESKRLSGNITINSEGEFIRQYTNTEGKVYKKEGLYSPIRQNEIHLSVLADFIKSNKIIKNYPLEALVVISNGKTIINRTYASKAIQNSIVKFDQLDTKMLKIMSNHDDIDVSDKKLQELATALLDNNIERQINYVEALGLELVDESIAEEVSKAQESGFIEDEAIAEKISDDSLIDKLKEYRLATARANHIQPYFIFNNAQLEDIINKMPKSKEEFVAIDGFGDKKFELYGPDILKIVNGDDFKLEETREKPVEVKETVALEVNKLDNIEAELREYRTKKSRELNYKPYFIYNNEQMLEIINNKPTTKEELISISGFGEKKYEMYGEDIIAIVKQFK